jgi:hypothetical protein
MVLQHVLLQPLALVTVRLYVPDWVTVMQRVVSPVLQRNVVFQSQLDGPHIVAPFPLQLLLPPHVEIEQEGSSFTFTHLLHVLEQPLLLVTVT